jgi:hypothetical protein
MVSCHCHLFSDMTMGEEVCVEGGGVAINIFLYLTHSPVSLSCYFFDLINRPCRRHWTQIPITYGRTNVIGTVCPLQRKVCTPS